MTVSRVSNPPHPPSDSQIRKLIMQSRSVVVLEQDTYHVGLTMTTSTYATTMLNLFPIFIFVLALIFRLEKIKIKEIKSIAKISGAIIAFCRSLVMTFFKGPLIGRGELRIGEKIHGVSSGNNLVGFILFFIFCIAWAGFITLQTIVMREYPHELSLVALVCFTGTIESTLVAEHGRSPGWMIGWDWELSAIVYSVLVAIVSYYGLGKFLKNKGPVFVTAFSPVMTVFTALTGLFVTGVDLFLGGLIGAILVFLGLFSVLWGKSRDEILQRENDGDQTATNIDDLDNFEDIKDLDNCLDIENADNLEQIEPKIEMEFDGIVEIV